MDIQTIDQQYQQLQGQSQQTIQELQAFAGKLQAVAQTGDMQAREWLLDLRSIALAFKAEQDQVANLLQALHGYVANEAQQQQQMMMPPPQQQSAWMQPQAQPAYAQQPPQGGGGILGGFLNSGFGRAIEMGAGFGLGDDLIKKIF